MIPRLGFSVAAHMSIRIKRHLQSCYPDLADLLGGITTVPKLRRRDLPLPEALVRVVAGQMLSAQAAATIYERVRSRAQADRLAGSWLLGHDSLRSCGLSGSKARTICDIAAHVGSDAAALDHWYGLPPDELMAAIRRFRGLGDWTASIIGLFYVGHEDVFPAADGSIQRAIMLIEERLRPRGQRRKRRFDPDLATPYRSYLAMYLWRALDGGLLAQPRA
jgi:DNA-3-methyladenine glycosylase II